MYLQEILEVGIGLVFIWLVISIAVMSVQVGARTRRFRAAGWQT
jgi:Na+-transporting methylmalonyl-CoA/oxaloacetate decarboxylase gamma subunit